MVLRVQLREPGLEVLLEGLRAAHLRDQEVFRDAADPLAERLTQAHSGVVLDNSGLYLLDGHHWLFAGLGLAASAEVVKVGAAVTLGAHDDQALATGSASQCALAVGITIEDRNPIAGLWAMPCSSA